MARTILEICSSKAAPLSQELLELVEALVLPASRSERPDFELKLTFDDSTRGWAELLKDIVSMANFGGGLICFGIDNNGEKAGLHTSLLSKLDPAQVSNKITSKSAARIETNYHEVAQGDLLLGFLIVRSSGQLVVFDHDGDFADSERRQNKAFQKGVVYTRRPGGNIAASQRDLDLLVERVVGDRTRIFLSRIERIANLPPDSDLVATDPASKGAGYLLSPDGKGIPVTFQQPDESTTALPIREILTASVPFRSINAEVINHVRLWKQADRNHRVSRETLTKWYLQRDQLAFDEDAAELCLVSALEVGGYPMHWASKLSRDRLLGVFNREIRSSKYRVREQVPLVVGLFFWERRKELLQPHLGVLFGRAARVAQKVMSFDDAARSQFVLYGRSSVKTFPFEGKTYRFSDFGNDLVSGEEMLEKLLQAEISGTPAYQVRYAAQRLDMILAAPHGV